MKNLLLIVSAACCFSTASAQFGNCSWSSGPERMQIVQVDLRDSSTLVFMEYTAPDASVDSVQWMNFSDGTYIHLPGSNKRYHLLASVNMPISWEAEPKRMIFDEPGQKHRWVLEFEKLAPETAVFDLVEEPSNPQASNFSGIALDTSVRCDYADVASFIEGYPVKEYGSYADEGDVIQYYKTDEIGITLVPSLRKQYGKYLHVDLRIQNFGNRSILIDPAKIKITGYKKDKKTGNTVAVDLHVLSLAEYHKIVHRRQSWNSLLVGLGEGAAAANAGYSTSTTTYSGSTANHGNVHVSARAGSASGSASIYGSTYTTTYGQSTTRSYDGAAAYAAAQQARANTEAFAQAQDEIRQQIVDEYLKIHTLPAGTDYSGSFNAKYEEVEQAVIEITLNGETYSFYL